jgi:predicted ATPase/class 3 adenylate cyclase/serine/threonine-protein kinase RIO1
LDEIVAGCRISETAHLGRRSRLLVGFDLADSRRVAIKLPLAEYPSEADIGRIKSEHSLLGLVHHSGVVAPVALREFGGSPALVLEYVPGTTLAEFLDGRELSVVDALRITASCAHALAAVHGAGIVHKELSPWNLMLHPRTQAVTLIDFGSASVLTREGRLARDLGSKSRNFAYISPEQTGRLCRTVDHRSDLYSLGILMHQLLTGSPPFVSDVPMELVHRHIAYAPMPCSKIRTDVPESVSQIVLRLLAKEPDERYQSAAGLVADIEESLSRMQADREFEPFALGRRDLISSFHLPEGLYGREEEREAVLRAFEQCRQGPRLFLIAGYSGVGKSRLIKAVCEQVLRHRSFFVSGKFDALTRDVPFASLHEAFRDLVRQVLTEDPDHIETWRLRLLDAFGGNGRVVIDAVPELERLIGPQPSVPSLPPRETRNRFRRLMRAFLNAFCRPEQPLCLFLDDLQWADSATLNWIEGALTDPETRQVFIIGAYRDNEVSSAHPLSLSIDRLVERNASVDRLQLAPLGEPVLEHFVADALRSDRDRAGELSKWIFRITQGNPFFSNQLLLSMNERGELVFDPGLLCWTYSSGRLSEQPVTENVADLLVQRMQRLSDGCREALKAAACAGHAFDLDRLAQLMHCSEEVLRSLLEEAVMAGLLRATEGSTEYRFRHDRVQQTALKLVPADELKRNRLRLGRMLLESRADSHLFEALSHLGSAEELVSEPEERQRLAHLSLVAARRARASSALSQALSHALFAEQFANLSSSQELKFGIALERANCEHLLSEDAAAEKHFEAALQLAATPQQEAEVYEAQVHFLTNRADFRRAYERGRSGAARFGVHLPASFVPPLMLKDLARIEIAAKRIGIARLAELPEMSDPELLLGSRLATASLKAAYQVRPELCVAGAAAIVRLCLSKGNFDDCAVAYLPVGPIFHSGVLKRHESGFEWGQMCLRLQERFDNIKQRAEVNFVYAYFSNSWMRPLETTEAHFRDAYQAGIDTGDHFHAACACSGLTQSMFIRGRPLAAVLAECERFLPFLEQIGAQENHGTVIALRQTIRNLFGQTRSKRSFSDDVFDQDGFESLLRRYGSQHFAHFYFVDRLQTLVIWGETDQAARLAAESAKFLRYSIGMQHAAEHHFYAGLAAACSLTAGQGGRKERAQLYASVAKFARWARQCAPNFEAKSTLLQAEKSRITGDDDRTSKLYDRAIEAAASTSMLQVEALACERAATFHLSKGRQRTARFYLRDAVFAYRRWGANAVAEDLGSRYKELGSAPVEESQAESPGSRLDLDTVLKAARAIAGEVKLPALLATLVGLVIENAGADRCILLLPKAGTFFVEAEGTAEQTTVLQGISLTEHPSVARSVVNYVIRTEEPVVLNAGETLGAFISDPYLAGSSGPRSLMCVPLMNRGELGGILYLENRLVKDVFTEARRELLTLLSGQFAISIENALNYRLLDEKVRERTEQLRSRNQLLRQIFGRYNSEDVVERLLEEPTGLQMGGQLREISVLSSDMRGFTARTATLPAENVVRLVNNYCEEMTAVVARHGGMVNELTGDGMLVMFGAATEMQDHALRAVACAVEMQLAMVEVNRRNGADGLPAMEMGVGICTGEVVVGNIGSLRRTKYSAIGMAVNLAVRIESYTHGGQVFISQRTLDLSRGLVSVSDKLSVEPKGAGRIDVYDIDGVGGELGLFLKRNEDRVRPVNRDAGIRIQELRGKKPVGEPFEGCVVGVSDTGVLVQAETCPPPLTDVSFRITLDGTELAACGFGKVLGGAYGSAQSVRLRFTSLPEEIRRALMVEPEEEMGRQRMETAS